MTETRGRIIEIFSSLQGEGLWVGRPQTFVRFHGCRLACTYCDTPLTHKTIHEARIEFPPYSKKFEKHSLEFSVADLNAAIGRFAVPSLAVTGGEPLEQGDFLEVWFPSLEGRYEILLETSGVEVDTLRKIISHVAMISLDLKLPSSSGEKPHWDTHRAFLEIALQRSCYAKVVFDEKMTEEEEGKLLGVLEDHPSLEMVFQPVSPLRQRNLEVCLKSYQRIAERYPFRTRLIPQMHKFLSVL